MLTIDNCIIFRFAENISNFVKMSLKFPIRKGPAPLPKRGGKYQTLYDTCMISRQLTKC